MVESAADPWPALSYADFRETGEALHLWTQIVGKVRLALTPWLNHSWHAPLYVTARGLGTGLIMHPAGPLDLEFDFIDEALHIRGPAGGERAVWLAPMSVADFYERTMTALAVVGAPTKIHAEPSEIADATPFAQDRRVRAYDDVQALRFWRILVQAVRVLGVFRTSFIGKASPVHFFWGGFDLAVTRFSGRPAPPHPGGIPNLPDSVTREAYSHEVSSAGFWPGGGGIEEPAFYAYAYPEPAGFRTARVEPTAARYHEGLGEFILPYDAVRTSADPDATLAAFLQSTYRAAADAGGWDRALECKTGRPGVPRTV